MKIHITNIYGLGGIGQLSQHKTAQIARGMGFHEMGLYRYPTDVDSDRELSSRMDGIISSLQYGDIVFIQSPSWNGLRYDLQFIRRIKSYPGVKICIFAHDILPLFFDRGEEELRATIDIYNHADLIIVSSKAILEILRQNGLTVAKQMVQEMWDYPVSFDANSPQYLKQVFFIGEPTRFPFVREWRYQTPMRLYSVENCAADGLNIEWRSFQKEMKLLSELSEGGYGLVWSSKQANAHYQLLQPYKVANYLAAGIPVIMQRGLVPEQIIIDNGLGFVVDSLAEADEMIQSTGAEEYNRMVQRISEFNFLIKDGWFTKKLLTDAVMLLLNNKREP